MMNRYILVTTLFIQSIFWTVMANDDGTCAFEEIIHLRPGFGTSCNESTCIPCELNPNPDPDRRRRYEIRDLPPGHWDSFAFAVKEMHNLTMKQGQAKYGPLFKNHAYMLAFHIFATDSHKGEQAHFGAHFLPFHSALTLMYETIILTITKANGLPLESTPYWWSFKDTDQSDILGPEYFGTHPGLGPHFEVTDGEFANWTIPLYNETYEEFMYYAAEPNDVTYYGNKFGYLRESKSELWQKYYTAFPMGAEMNHSATYEPTSLHDIMQCVECGYDRGNYTIYHFAWCVQERWHTYVHSGIGGWRWDKDGSIYGGDFTGAQANIAPYFIPYHNSIDMFYLEWVSSYPEHANTSWGYPYDKAYNYVEERSYEGINAQDTINSAFPIRWLDVGWAPPNSTEANNTMTYLEAMCYFTRENADYVYVKFSHAPEKAPGINVSIRDFEVYEAASGGGVAVGDADVEGTQRDADKESLLPAAEAFLGAYDTQTDNRIEAAEAFLEALSSSAEVGSR